MALKSEAVKAGMVDVDGLKLADLSGVTIKDGKLDGADALFTSEESKPYLFGSRRATAAAQTPCGQTPEAKHAKDMTDAEYAAEKASSACNTAASLSGQDARGQITVHYPRVLPHGHSEFPGCAAANHQQGFLQREFKTAYNLVWASDPSLTAKTSRTRSVKPSPRPARV
jgi:hypothetical protein